MPATIGDVVATIIRTLNKSNGAFKVDPNTTAGYLNLLSAEKLVLAEVLEQNVVDAFFAIGKTTTYPYIDRTQEQLDEEKEYMRLAGSAEHTSIQYPDDLDYMLSESSELVITTEIQDIDVNFHLEKYLSTDGDNYAIDSAKLPRLHLPKGLASTSLELGLPINDKRIKLVVVADKDIEFHVVVTKL